jgi:hypothetical protein
MEHGSEIECFEYMIDQNYTRYVGWEEDCGSIKEYYSPYTVKLISKKVSELLQGVDPRNRKIVVPDQTIINVMNGIEYSYRPETGDIYSRYNVPKSGPIDDIQEMINQSIELIVSDVRNNLEMDQNNQKLTAWTTILGDFNEQGLRSYPPIKIRNKHPNHFQFNMNY